jgi:hypothetical protein
LPVLPVAFFIYAFPHPLCACSRFSLSRLHFVLPRLMPLLACAFLGCHLLLFICVWSLAYHVFYIELALFDFACYGRPPLRSLSYPPTAAPSVLILSSQCPEQGRATTVTRREWLCASRRRRAGYPARLGAMRDAHGDA